MQFKKAGVLAVSGAICFFSALAAAGDEKRWPIITHASQNVVLTFYWDVALMLALMFIGVFLCGRALVHLVQSINAVIKHRKAVKVVTQ